MFINLNNPFFGSPIQYTLNITIGNATQSETQQTIPEMAIVQAIQLCQQVTQDSHPIKIEYIIPEYIEGREENDGYIKRKLVYGNKAWVKEFGEVEAN